MHEPITDGFRKLCEALDAGSTPAPAGSPELKLWVPPAGRRARVEYVFTGLLRLAGQEGLLDKGVLALIHEARERSLDLHQTEAPTTRAGIEEWHEYLVQAMDAEGARLFIRTEVKTRWPVDPASTRLAVWSAMLVALLRPDQTDSWRVSQVVALAALAPALPVERREAMNEWERRTGQSA